MSPWIWLIVGAALAVAELLVPGIFLIWLGVAAILMAPLVWLVPDIAWQVQTLIYVGVAIGLVAPFMIIRFRSGRQTEMRTEGVNDRMSGMMGQSLILVEPIVNGHGRARFGDGEWPVTGPDLPAGAAVRVVAADGIRLRVEGVR